MNIHITTGDGAFDLEVNVSKQQYANTLFPSLNREDDIFNYHLPGAEFFRLLVWSLTLLIGYGIGRILCLTQTLSDNDQLDDQLNYNVLDNLYSLLAMGFTLYYFTCAHSEKRFNYIFGFSAKTRYSGAWFVFFFVAPFAWRWFNPDPFGVYRFADHVVENDGTLSVIVVVLFILVVFWHIFASLRLGVLWTYLGSRIFVFGVFALFFINDPIANRVNDYQIAWVFALLGCLNHPLSLLTLALGMALFVDGLARHKMHIL